MDFDNLGALEMALVLDESRNFAESWVHTTILYAQTETDTPKHYLESRSVRPESQVLTDDGDIIVKYRAATRCAVCVQECECLYHRHIELDWHTSMCVCVCGGGGVGV